MKTQEIRVPDIGDFSDVEIIEVLVSVGDTIAVEDSLITIESDKASMEIPSPQAGKVLGLSVSEGDKVSKGSLILLLEAEDVNVSPATSKPSPDALSSAPAVAPVPKPAPRPQPSDSPTASISHEAFKKAYASPSVRKFARELGVDLGKVSGSGRKHRIVKEDVKSYVKDVMSFGRNAPSAPAQGGMGIPPMPDIDFSQWGEIEVQELSRINKLTGEFLHRNWLHIPHVTQFDQADITELEAFRKQLNAEQQQAGSAKITPLVFIMKAVVAALKTFPRFNTSLGADGTSLIQKKYFNIGIAVDTADGLVVPVIRDVDKKSLSQLSEELHQASVKARDKKLKPADLQGGCFSISSLGGIGGTKFTPIVNAPEVAILGVSRAEMQPVWDGEQFAPRLMLPLSLSYDHRVIDGADGARFTTYLSTMLADIRRLLV